MAIAAIAAEAARDSSGWREVGRAEKFPAREGHARGRAGWWQFGEEFS